MANNYVISPSATREIEGILVYLSDVLMSSDAALSFLDELERQLQITCQFPGSHPVCPHPDLAERGYRSFRIKRYVAICSFSNDTVNVLHVFHQLHDYARDAIS